MKLRLVLACSLLAVATSAAERPNIVVIITDDQGYGDLSAHGNPVLKTPALDRLHAESVRLANFHVSPMCTPTRSQLMTGRHALANAAYHVTSGRTFIRPEIPTMPELLAASGYKTGLFGKWHLGDNYPHRPNDRGFQEAVYHAGWGITCTPDYWNGDYFDDHFSHNGVIKQYRGFCTDVFFDEAGKWVRERAARREPFFLYLALNAPHGPFFAPEKDKAPYRHLDKDTAGFFAMMANLDDNYAKFDELLRAAGIRDNTIVVFLTDNGSTGGVKVFNAGLRGAKASLYDGGHRAIGFVRWPAGRLRPPGDVTELTEVQDLLPTLLELAGVEPKAGVRFDGTSLAPVLRGRAMPELADRKLVVQYGGLVESQPQLWDAAVMWNSWRLVSGKELYDVASDPGQRTNVAEQFPGVVRLLRAHYEQWWASVEPGLREPVRIVVGSPRENPSRLTSMDWYARGLTAAAQPFDVRLAGRTVVVEGSLPGGRPQPAMNGPWLLHVEQAGRYRVGLRRWPVEADAAIRAPLPPYQGVDGSFPAGVALPVATARLRVGEFDRSKPVTDEDKEAVFEVTLPAGPLQLQTWFLEADGKEICGAFYVEVRRL